MNNTDRFKFRAWNYKWESWMRDDFQISNDGCWLYHEADHWIIGDEVEVVQCTGLKDKNGKLIYEGDIIENCSTLYVVPNFTPLDRFYEATSIDSSLDNSDDWMSNSDIDWEIIGNIYENPELLKNEQKQ